MADVIAKLKVDAKEYDGGLAKAKKSLDQFTKQNMSLNGIMAQGMTALTKFAGGFAAAEVAAKSFNAIIMQGSQVTGDFIRNGVGALNDTMEILASSIATMDFSPFEDGLANVFRRAVELNAALDELNNKQISMGLVNAKYGSQLSEATTIIRDTASTQEQIAEATKQGTQALDKMKEAAGNTQKKIVDVVQATVSNMSGITDVTWGEIEKVILSDVTDDADKLRKAYNDAMAKQPTKPVTVANQWGGSTTYGGSYEEYNKDMETWRANNREQIIGYALLQKASDKRYKSIAEETMAYYDQQTAISQTERAWNRTLKTADKAINSTTNSVGGKTAKPTAKAAEPIKSSMSIQDFDIPDLSQTIFDRAIPSMDELNKLAKYWTDQMNKATSQDQFLAAENALKKIEHDMEIQPIALRFGFSMPRAEMQNMLNEKYDDLTVKVKADLEADKKALSGTNSLEENGKGVQKSFEAASRAISSAGSALQSVDNEGLNIAGTIMQAIADVALGFAMALASPTAAATGPWGWIAAAAAGAATMVATIATIKSATSGSYAQGGIVPGAYNGGLDSTYVYASPGEVILNRAQQENILSQLDDGSSSGNVTFVLNGEKLEGCLNHYGRRSGKGKLVFA